jgi:hypothetical protein
MNKKFLAALLATTMAVSSARAVLIAGWDFSQYLGDGIGSTNGSTLTETLSANYSSLDTTFGAGAASAAFGTLYYDGSFGSTNVNPDGTNDAIWPTSGSLNSNLSAGGPFDRHTVLANEGQQFTQFLSLTNQSAVTLVFKADLTSTTFSATNWSLSFGAKTFASTASVGIAYSTNGSSYTALSNQSLTTTDTAYSVALTGLGETQTSFVRLTFAAPSGGGVGQSIIDNVAILGTVDLATPVPEPSTYAAIFGVLALGGAAWHRRRRVSA